MSPDLGGRGPNASNGAGKGPVSPATAWFLFMGVLRGLLLGSLPQLLALASTWETTRVGFYLWKGNRD